MTRERQRVCCMGVCIYWNLLSKGATIVVAAMWLGEAEERFQVTFHGGKEPLNYWRSANHYLSLMLKVIPSEFLLFAWRTTIWRNLVVGVDSIFVNNGGSSTRINYGTHEEFIDQLCCKWSFSFLYLVCFCIWFFLQLLFLLTIIITSNDDDIGTSSHSASNHFWCFALVLLHLLLLILGLWLCLWVTTIDDDNFREFDHCLVNLYGLERCLNIPEELCLCLCLLLIIDHLNILEPYPPARIAKPTNSI